MATTRTVSHDALILNRVVNSGRADLSSEAARALLEFDFSRTDRDRMHELSLKVQGGALLPGEQDELESYRRVGYFLDLLRSKARKALKTKKPSRGT